MKILKLQLSAVATVAAFSSNQETLPSQSLLADGGLAVLGSLTSWGSTLTSWGTGSSALRVTVNDAETLFTSAQAAMADVCTATVRMVEGKMSSPQDALHFSGAAAPVCEEQARVKLGSEGGQSFMLAAAAAALDGRVAPYVQDWCSNLDGRLALAMETGFLFTQLPDGAAQAAPLPTRRQFCDRFAQAVNTTTFNHKHSTAATMPTQPPVAQPSPSSQEPAKESTEAGVHEEAQPGIDMLHLVQSLSTGHDGAWGRVCRELVSGLASAESTVTDRQSISKVAPGSDAAQVFTFNAPDQAHLGRCAVQFKVLALETGMMALPSKETTPALVDESGVTADGADFAEATGVNRLGRLGADEGADLEVLVESPWARDACADIARGFLTARLAEKTTSPAEFCQRYSTDLRQMRAQPIDPAEERRQQELEDLRRLKRRGVEKALRRQEAKTSIAPVQAPVQASQALAKAPAKVVALTARNVQGSTTTSVALQSPAVPPAQVVAPAASTDAGEDEGASFWSR